MSDQLIYTSAPAGLRPGTSGFCTVAATALGPAWVQRLEALSGYKPLYPAGDARESANPIGFAHTRITVAGATRSVLTRSAFAGADHTGRSNKLVSHIVLTDAERGPGGPAWAIRQPGLMPTAWQGEPRLLPAGTPVPTARPTPMPATTWQHVTGDAAWAAALAQHAMDDPSTIVYVLYEAGTDIAAMFDEAIRLLPEPKRWAVTFNTYLTEPPAGAPCAWRGIVAGSPAAALARGAVIDLIGLNAAALPTGLLADAARTGRPAASGPAVMENFNPAAASSGAFGTERFALGTRQQIQPAIMPPVGMSMPGESRRSKAGLPSNVALPRNNSNGSKAAIAIAVSIGAALLVASGITAIMILTSSSTPSNDNHQQTTGLQNKTSSGTSGSTLQSASQPTSQPNLQPVSQPTSQPASQPTSQPSSQPSTHPPSPPSSQPASQPSWRSPSQPSSQPTSQPSSQSSWQPASQPISRPTSPSQSTLQLASAPKPGRDFSFTSGPLQVTQALPAFGNSAVPASWNSFIPSALWMASNGKQRINTVKMDSQNALSWSSEIDKESTGVVFSHKNNPTPLDSAAKFTFTIEIKSTGDEKSVYLVSSYSARIEEFKREQQNYVSQKHKKFQSGISGDELKHDHKAEIDDIKDVDNLIDAFKKQLDATQLEIAESGKDTGHGIRKIVLTSK